MVFFHLSEQCVGIELLMVEHKDCCTSKPLSIELSPYGFAPARVSYGEVQ